MPPIPKPTPRKTLKARQKREEAAVIRRVRAACVERDGYCRLAAVHRCEGPSEWAHAHSHRRSKTRGLPPEQRHDTRWTLMLCKAAHSAYDAKLFNIELHDGKRGLDYLVAVYGDVPDNRFGEHGGVAWV